MSWTEEAHERAELARMRAQFDANNAAREAEAGMVYDVESERMVHVSELHKPSPRLTLHSFEGGAHTTFTKEM